MLKTDSRLADSTASGPSTDPEDAGQDGDERGATAAAPADEALVQTVPHLPFWTRTALYVVGILFLVLGIAGLFLPILQGVLFLLVGAAVLSVANERVYDVMYRLLHRRPKLWGRVHRFRERVHAKLHRQPPRDE